MTGEPALFELPQKYLDLREEARSLAAACADIAARADEADRFDPDVRERLVASGLTSVVVDAEYGGRFDRVDSLAVTVVREALAFESAHLDSMFAMQGIGSFAVSVGGSDSIRKQWLPKVAALEAIGALALTEPEVGSDLRAITTTLVEKDGELVVNGHKSFITNAGDADFYSVLCREGEAYSLVLVPADTAGITVTSPHQIIAPHVLGDVVLENVRVPLDHRLGEPGKGFKLMLATLATFRVSVAGAAVGLAQASLEEALRHATGRIQFGVPLAQLGPVPSKLAESWVEIEMARAMTYQAAAAAAQDPLGCPPPLVDRQGGRHRDGGARHRPLRPGDGPLRPGARQQDRAALPRGASDAHLRRLDRGHLDSLAKKLVKDRQQEQQ